MKLWFQELEPIDICALLIASSIALLVVVLAFHVVVRTLAPCAGLG